MIYEVKSAANVYNNGGSSNFSRNLPNSKKIRWQLSGLLSITHPSQGWHKYRGAG
jgi:hypothetical protein